MCSSGLRVGSIGGAGPCSCCHVAASQAGQLSPDCLPLRPRHTTPRLCCAPLANVGRWKGTSDVFCITHSMCKCVVACVCVSCLCPALYLKHNRLQLITCSCFIVLCLFPNVSTMSGMLPPSNPQHVILFVWSTTWFSCFVRRGQNFSDFFESVYN